MKRELIAGKNCFVIENNLTKEDTVKCIFLGMQEQEENSIQRIAKLVKEDAVSNSFLLVVYEVKDWNAAFSPWRAEPVFGKEAFLGKASETLAWLEEQCIPFIKTQYLPGKRIKNYLAGYSLAGLFSLWSVYQSDIFTGVASCSGSLWFPDWINYIQGKTVAASSNIYLSLGTKEAATRNVIMSKVKENTRLQDAYLQQDKNVKEHILEWNPGGHFHQIDKRIAKGIVWLLNESSIKNRLEN